MNTQVLAQVEESHIKDVPEINVGDTVNVSTYITEGGKTRTQLYRGLVIAIKGSGTRKMVTVRKVAKGFGVERIFPLHSPNIKSWEVVKSEKVRRAKLYYMRERVGKSATRLRKGKSQI